MRISVAVALFLDRRVRAGAAVWLVSQTCTSIIFQRMTSQNHNWHEREKDVGGDVTHVCLFLQKYWGCIVRNWHTLWNFPYWEDLWNLCWVKEMALSLENWARYFHEWLIGCASAGHCAKLIFTICKYSGKPKENCYIQSWIKRSDPGSANNWLKCWALVLFGRWNLIMQPSRYLVGSVFF